MAERIGAHYPRLREAAFTPAMGYSSAPEQAEHMKASASAESTRRMPEPWRRSSRDTRGDVDPLGKTDRGRAPCVIGTRRRTTRNESKIAAAAQLPRGGLMVHRRGARVVDQLLTDGGRRPCRFMVYGDDGGQSFDCARAVRESKWREQGDHRDCRPPHPSRSVEPHDLEVLRRAAHAIKIAAGAAGCGRRNFSP